MDVVAVDTNVLINLMHVGRLAVLGDLRGYRFVVPREVESEIREDEQARALQQAFAEGWIGRVEWQTTEELALFAEFAKRVGTGEAACLAFACARGWGVASDDRRFRRLAEERIGRKRLWNTPGIFVLAIRQGLLTVEEADTAKAVLERHRYKMRFSSFREVVQELPEHPKP